MKLYLIRRQDFFTPAVQDWLPEDCVQEAGSIWITVAIDSSFMTRCPVAFSPA